MQRFIAGAASPRSIQAVGLDSGEEAPVLGPCPRFPRHRGHDRGGTWSEGGDHGPCVEPSTRPGASWRWEGFLWKSFTPSWGACHGLPLRSVPCIRSSRLGIFAKVSGYLKWQEVDIGSQVTKGKCSRESTIRKPSRKRTAPWRPLKQAKTQVVQASARG